MSEDANLSKPDIVVDDDWKAQVEKEKEALKDKEQQDAQTPAGQSGSDAGAPESFEMPPASFLVLMSTLATQTMASLGMIGDPATGEANVNRPMACLLYTSPSPRDRG